MKKRTGIYGVLDKHNDLTKRMNEDARYSIINDLDEADDEMDMGDEPNPDDGIEGGLGLDDTENQTPEDAQSDEEDALDLDALVDDTEGLDMPEPDQSMGGDNMGGTNVQPAMGTEPTEEIDVTDFIEKSSELTQKVDSQVQTMSQQIDTLTQKLASMDQIIGKIQQVEDEINAMRPPKPIETLKLRSLDSYPYNQGIDDYWKHKEVEIEKLRDFNRVDNQEYVLTTDDVNNFSDIDIKDSLRPSKQQVSTSFPGPSTNQQQTSSFNKQKQ